MAVNISGSQFAKMRKRAEGALTRLKGMKEKAADAAGRVVQTMTIGGVSFGFGVVHGRFVDEQGNRGIEFVGIPLELFVGGVSHLLGFVGGMKYADHLHNLGNGAIASYATMAGVGVGERMRLREAQQEGGDVPATSGARRRVSAPRSTSTDDLLNIARGQRAY